MPMATTVPTVKIDPHTVSQPAAAHRALASGAIPLRHLLPAVVSGVLLWLCFFPVGWGWLGWIALVPLLVLVRTDVPLAQGQRFGFIAHFKGFLRRPSYRVAACAFVGSLVFFVPILQWMRVGDRTMYVAWIATAVICSLFSTTAVVLVRWVDRRTAIPLVVSLPAIWTALEFLRTHPLGGFPWYFTGHTQFAFLPVIQISDVTGAYGVSFLVAAVNVLVFELLAGRPAIRKLFGLVPGKSSRRSLLIQFAVILTCLGGTLIYGFWRLSQNEFGSGPLLALVQGNLPQDVKDHGSPVQVFRHYAALSELAAHQDAKPNLIIWPETSCPEWEEIDFTGSGVNVEEALSLPSHWLSRMNPLLFEEVYSEYVPVLVGVDAFVTDSRTNKRRPYNSAILLEPGRRSLVDGFAVCSFDFLDATALVYLRDYQADGRLRSGEAMPIHRGQLLPRGADAVIMDSSRNARAEGGKVMLDTRIDEFDRRAVYPGQNLVRLAGRYDKIHLVPLGEYVPFEKWTSVLQKFTPYPEGYGVEAGTEFKRFSFQDREGKAYHFGVVICYEDTDPCLARQYATPEMKPVDFIVNMSNDGWFKGTSEHEQHLALARFRAIECRRTLVRSVNMGVSAVIDGNGRVLAPSKIDRVGEDVVWRIEAGSKSELPVSRWAEFKSVPAVLTAQIPVDSRASLYARFGDWFAWCCAVLAIIAICYPVAFCALVRASG
jgi:apolipoprotein N-acyltransferase